MKKFVCLALVFVMMLSCVGTLALAEEKKTLTIAYNDSDAMGEAGYRQVWIKNTFEAWDKKDQYELVIQEEPVIDGDFFTKMQLQLSDASTAPDIILYDTFQLHADIPAGYFMDLTDLLAGYPEWNDGSYYEATKAGVTSADGKVYGIPSDTDTRGLWVNVDVLEAAGLGADWQPTNWQEILDAAQKIKDWNEDVIPMWMSSSAVEAESTTMNSFLMFYYGTGERLVDDATGIWNINSEGMYNSLKFFYDLYDLGLGGAEYEVIDANAYSTMADYFQNGQLGIMLSGNWVPARYMETGASPWEGFMDHMKFIKMPNYAGDGFQTLSGGWALTMSSTCPIAEDAFEFMTMLMDPELGYINNYVVPRGNLGTRTECVESETYTNAPFFDVATEFLDFTAYRPANENYSTISSFIYTAVEMVVTGTSVEDAMAYYDQAVTDLVGADFVNDCGYITK